MAHLLQKKIRAALAAGTLKIGDPTATLSGLALRDCVEQLAKKVSSTVPTRGVVGIVAENSSAQGIAILATWLAGRIPMPLSPQWRSSAHWKTLQSFFAGEIYFESTGPDCRALSTAKKRPAAPRVAIILSTSGSSGNLKIVGVLEKNILSIASELGMRFLLGPHTKAAICVPNYHAVGIATQFVPTVLSGGACFFIDNTWGASHLYRDLLKVRPTFLAFVPATLLALERERALHGLPPLASANTVQLSGDFVHRQHTDIAQKIFPSAKIVRGYGLTEAIRISMIDSQNACFNEPNVGFLLPHRSVKISGRAKDVGEICVADANITLYSSERNKKKGGKFTRTGDWGTLSNKKLLTVLGRRSDILKAGSRWISAHEIEGLALLFTQYQQAKCLLTRKNKRDCAVLFLGRGMGSLDPLKSELKKMPIPVEVVVIKSLPLLINGKVNRVALKKMLPRSFRPKAET